MAVKYKPMICTTILTTLPITDENKNIYINSYITAPLTFESVNWSLIFIELVAPKRAGFFGSRNQYIAGFLVFFSFFVFLDKTPFNFWAIYDFSVFSCYCDLCLGSPLR